MQASTQANKQRHKRTNGQGNTQSVQSRRRADGGEHRYPAVLDLHGPKILELVPRIVGRRLQNTQPRRLPGLRNGSINQRFGTGKNSPSPRRKSFQLLAE